MTETLRRNLLEALVIFALGAVLGLSFNYQLLMDVFSGKTVQSAAPPAPQSAVASAPQLVDLNGVQERLAAGALAVDARIIEMFAEGHLPGARALPLDELADYLDAFKEQVPRDRELILYCSGFGCPDSGELAGRLVAEGYTRVLVYEGGFPEWQGRGLPVEGGAQ